MDSNQEALQRQLQLSQSVVPQGKTAINDYNIQLHSQPWYQEYLASIGQTPKQGGWGVKLSKDQRQSLERLILQHGGPRELFQDNMIDPAGNFNTEHGFASQPTWLKALEIGGAAGAGAFFGGPAIAGMLGHAAPTAATAPALGSSEAFTTLAGTGGLVPGLSGLTTGFVPAAATSGMAATAPTSILSATGGGATASGNSVGSYLGKFLGKKGGSGSDDSTLPDAASMLGSFAQQSAQNRGANAGISGNYTNQMISSQANQRNQETDAMRKLGESSYILQGGSHFKPPTISLGGQERTTPDLGYGPMAPSDAQKQAATTLQSEMLKRVQPGSGYTPPPLDEFTKSGTAEKVANTGSLILGGINTARNIFGF